jgi:hypothetical protein
LRNRDGLGRVAIIGGGLVGTCTALELSDRGYKVDIFEAHSELVCKASQHNEGKIHLGFIYALDLSLNTAHTMIEGAIQFVELLSRWIKFDIEDLMSTPFHYCVHKGTLAKADKLVDHYQSCADLFDDVRSRTGLKYLGLIEKIYSRRMKEQDISDIANPEYIDAAFETNEYAIDTYKLASLLRQSVKQTDKITVRANSKVVGLKKSDDNSFRIQYSNLEGAITWSPPYDYVVNAAWSGRLEVDSFLGIKPKFGWSHRYKFANRIQLRFENDDFPSCTIVQGPYGDTVNFRENGGFFSWYPVGRTGWSTELSPPDWDCDYTPEFRNSVFKESFLSLAKRIPKLNNIHFNEDDVVPGGGVIFAKGDQDIDVVESELHERFDIGVHSFGNYHSVDTGKYTLGPLLALKIANRIQFGE